MKEYDALTRELEPFDSLVKAEEHFKAKYAMKTKVNGNYLLLDYHMIDSPRKHNVVDLCRGTLVRLDPETKEWSYARRMFDRFYNYGECPGTEERFDWSTAVVEDKVDGSLIGVWYDNDAAQWQIGTRGNAFGDNCVTTLEGEEGTITFRDLFLRAFGGIVEFERCMRWFKGNLTLMFELCCYENKVVTSYPKDTLFLIGARRNDKLFGGYTRINGLDAYAHLLAVKRPERHYLDSFENVLQASHDLTGLKEGFVLYDQNDFRIKVKSLAYVTAHHLRGEGVTPKRATLMALAGEVDEFLTYFPEYANLLKKYTDRVAQVLSEAEFAYESLKHIPGQKEYAQKVIEGWPTLQAILFPMRAKGLTVAEAVANLKTSTKLGVFKPNG